MHSCLIMYIYYNNSVIRLQSNYLLKMYITYIIIYQGILHVLILRTGLGNGEPVY